MPADYKLRLGDGTILGVDEAGLRTWLVDEKAMVQPAHSRRWLPLREVLAQVQANAAAAARPAAAPPVPVPAPSRPIAVAAPRPAESTPPGPALDLAEVARTALTPIAEGNTGRTAKTADMPVIPFKPLDDGEARDLAAAKIHDEEDALEELPLVAPDTEDPLTRATRRGQAALASAVARVRRFELPVLRRVPDDEARAAEGRRRRLGTRGTLLVSGVAGAIVLVATGWAWLPPLVALGRRLSSPAEPKAVVAPPAASPIPPPPTLPPDVQAAVDQLPHLTPETIQLVMSRSAYRPRDPAEVFLCAEIAASRGTSSLPEEDARELRALRTSVTAALRASDRNRVRAYERIRVGRDLLSAGEDAKVLALLARGVRALPPPKRERLQVLLGRAIAADLAPSPSPEAGASTAAGTR